MLKILAVLCFGVFCYALAWLALSSSGKVVMQERYGKYFKVKSLDEVREQVIREKREKAKSKKTNRLQLANKQFSSELAMSGVKLSATEYLFGWVLLTIVPALLVLLFRGNSITALGIAIICFSGPPLLVKRSRKKRQDAFSKQLGESLVIIGNCVKSGFTFQQAMESIASEMQPPISDEFDKALREMHYGVSLEDALNHMVERVKNKDLDLLISAVLTSSRVGGNLSDILEVISETVRDRIKIKAEVRVMTSSGRTSGLIIGLLPVVIIIVLMLLNPNYFLNFFESQIGKYMIVLSIVLEGIGFFLINKIVNIKY